MNLKYVVFFAAASAVARAGVRGLQGAFPLSGNGDVNAAYATTGLLAANLLWVLVVAGLALLVIVAGGRKIAMIGWLGLVPIALIACFFGTITFWLVPVIFGAITLYAPLALAAGRSLPDALADSCRVATEAAGPTAGAVVLLAVGFAAATIVGGLVSAAQPIVGDLAAGIIAMSVVAYVAPGLAATYLKLEPPGEVS